MSSSSPASSSPVTATPGTSGSDLSFLYDLTSAPCFRKTTLIAMGGGGALGALRLYKTRDAMQAAETMVKGGCGVAILSWIACRKRFYDEREATYGAMEMLKKKQREQGLRRARELREKDTE